MKIRLKYIIIPKIIMTYKPKTTTVKKAKDDKMTIDLKGIRDMIKEWKVGPIYSMSGESQCGKTTLALQLAAEYSHKTGRSLCLYDTEGGGQEFLDAWMPVHQETYPKAKAVYRMKRNWRKILADHGIPTRDVDISKGGKMKVVPDDTLMRSEMDNFVEEHNIGVIIYDSMTMPMQAFGVNQENFPARNSAQQLWMHQMMDLIDEHQILVIITNHVTKNPTIPHAQPKLAGGKAIHHNSKVQFFIKKWEAKGVTHWRTVKLDRFYDVGKDTKECNLLLTDDGYVDKTADDLKAARKEGKAGV